ncbi:MAG: 2-oxo acid dehydrogenase subunit E2, partial [Nitrospiraceae bacterium]
MAKLWTFQDPGEGIHEAEVLKLLVARGDRVREGQEVLTVETDKASFDLSCPYTGVVEEIAV